jgi:hypothetical protein
MAIASCSVQDGTSMRIEIRDSGYSNPGTAFSLQLCQAIHTVFLAALATLLQCAANPHRTKRFMNGCLRAIKKSAA